MIVYLTFSRYLELGGELKEPEFIRAELMARIKIDSITFNRLQSLPSDDPVWEKVEYLVFELIHREYLGKLNGKDTTSESNNGRSVTYASIEWEAYNYIRTCLSATPTLFYAGNNI